MTSCQNTSFITFRPKIPNFDSSLTIQEAAERIQVSTSVVRYLISAGFLQASHRPRKRTCRLRESEIVRYLSYWFPKRDEDLWPDGEIPF